MRRLSRKLLKFILNSFKIFVNLESKTQSEITDAQMDKLRKLGEAAGVK